MTPDDDDPDGETRDVAISRLPSAKPEPAPGADSASTAGMADDAEEHETTLAADSVDVEVTAEDKDANEWTSPVRLATMVALIVVLALGCVVGYQSFRTYELQQREQDQRELFLRVGRQADNHRLAERRQ